MPARSERGIERHGGTGWRERGLKDSASAGTGYDRPMTP